MLDTPPPQTQPMILLFAVLMRYLHVSWSRKRDIGDITSSPPLRQLTDRKIYTLDINVFRNVCSPNEQLAHYFVKIPARNNTWKWNIFDLSNHIYFQSNSENCAVSERSLNRKISKSRNFSATFQSWRKCGKSLLLRPNTNSYYGNQAALELLPLWPFLQKKSSCSDPKSEPEELFFEKKIRQKA